MELFYVVAMPRSGHYAIAWWLACQNTWNLSPAATSRDKHDSNDDICVVQALDLQKGEFRILEDTTVRRRHESVIIINDERSSLSLSTIHQTFQYAEKQTQRKWHLVLILRDLYNNLASVCERKKTSRFHDTLLSDFCDEWRLLAREAAGLTGHLWGGTFIPYNKWFTSESYRRDLCSKLSLHFTDTGINQIPQVMCSSFDHYDFQGKAQEMSVLTRYKTMADNAEYREVLDDPELMDLNYLLFDMDPSVLW